MPWYMPWSDTLKKKVCRYLLQRYLGQFLEEKLSLEQLTVDFYKGTGTVTDVTLYAQALNDLCESQGWCIEVVGGRVGSIKVNIPWNALMSEDSAMEVNGLYMCIKPMARQQDGTSMLESMWSSMSSSMQLAQECLEKEGVGLSAAKKMEGLECFAQTIDNVLNRVKARLINTEIRLEYLIKDSSRGVALIIKIENLEYKNEAGGDPPDKINVENDSDENQQQQYSLSTYTTHHITMKGITFYTEEFRIDNGEMVHQPPEASIIRSEQYYSTISELPETNQDRLNESIEIERDDASENDTDEDKQIQKIYRTEQIMFGEISGTQEIRIKMKLTESVPGSKVQLEINLGALNFFLSPRQFHLLAYIFDFFVNTTPATSPFEAQRTCDDEQMPGTNSDDELKKQIDRLTQMTGGLGLNQGWSTDSTADTNLPNVNVNTSHLLRPLPTRKYAESIYSTNSSMSSSMCSTFSQSTHNTSRARKRGIIDPDPNADISSLNIRVACCAIVLLHEDVLVESASVAADSPLNEESVKKLKTMATDYFSCVGPLSIGMGVNEILRAGELLDKSCDSHHLRLLLAPIIVEGEEQRNASGNLLRLSISIARGDFREVLKETSVPLIEFIKKPKSSVLPTCSEIRIGIKQTTHSLRGSRGKRLAPPKTEISISLAPCISEVDITISDRLNSLFNTSPFMPLLSSSQSTKLDESKIIIAVKLENIDVKFRFPVVDLRPLHDSDRVPWWKRNVRPDYFLAHLAQAQFCCNLSGKYEVEAKEIELYYCEDELSSKISLAKASYSEKPGTAFTQSEIELPKVTVDVPSIESLENLASQGRNSDDSDGCPSIDYIGLPKPKEYSPFSFKRVCRESDTPHSKQGNENADSENIKIPGEKEEMDRFSEDAAKFSRIQISVFLPLVSLQLKSKHLYEILYNRINSDLLLWQPNAPRIPSCVPTATKIASSLLNLGMTDSIYAPFAMCKSGINYESSSSTSSESEAESEIIYYSVYDKHKTQKLIPPTDNTSAISFKLTVKNGMLTTYAPVRDSQNHVIPGQLGEFVIKINSAVMFSVNGYRGNEDLGYVCLQANSAELYHFGLIPGPCENPPLRLVGCVLPNHLQSTLYPSPKNISLCEPKGESKREMVSVAVQINCVPEQRIKRVKVAVGVQKTTLKHNTALPEHTWLTQLIDLFDVTDYPVQGYTSLGVVTEMHLHFWDCAIDYRPRYLPYRAIVSLGTFMMSSNISTASSGCTLRFVAEDSTMCLAPQKLLEKTENNRIKCENKITVLPANELVSVIDVDLLELSLRLSEKPSTAFPKLDLRASINGAHLRTCSDSASALAQLIMYLATEGDLNNSEEPTQDVQKSPKELGMELLPVKPSPPPVPTVSESQQKRVNSLMEEAMKESVYIVANESVDKEEQSSDQEDIFFFPDEANQKQTSEKSSQSGENSPTLSRSKSMSESISSSNTDKQDVESQRSNDSVSVNTELQDLLDFETSVMGIKPAEPAEPIETMPQVASELGSIVQPKTETRRISSDIDDDFCIISHEEKPSYDFGESERSAEPLRIIDNHFSVPIGKPDLLTAPRGFPMAVMRYTLCEMTLTWHIYGGNDFPIADSESTLKEQSKTSLKTPPAARTSRSGSYQPSVTIRTPMSSAYQMGVSYSKGSPNNVVFNTSSNNRKRTWKERGGPGRKHDVLMEVQITKARFSHETYPAHTEQVSRQVLLIGEIEIRDRLAVSNIKKFLYLPHTERRKSQNMIVVKTLHLRPDFKLRAQECCLRISMLPLRLNIDQDALLFLVEFFNSFGNPNDTNKNVKSNTPSHQPPIMMVDLPEAEQELQARKMVEENLMLLMEEEEKQKDIQESVGDFEDNGPIFFRNIVFSPAVLISLDYHGKKIELSHGPLAGLLMGLGQLQCSQILLKPLSHRNGILGVDRLINFFFREWLQDIKSHQLSNVLKGVGTMNTFIQLFQGIKDLFFMPIEQYQKDGRIVRGIQLGAQSFTARTALALLEITTKVIYLLQITAETAYDMVSPGPSVRRIRLNRKGKRKRLNPPQDIREGVTNAYHIVKEGFGDTANTIVEMTVLEHDQKGYTGAVGAVIRQIPPTVFKPIVLATQATTNVLGGVKNQLIPDARQESKEKWKDDDD